MMFFLHHDIKLHEKGALGFGMICIKKIGQIFTNKNEFFFNEMVCEVFTKVTAVITADPRGVEEGQGAVGDDWVHSN